MQERQTYIDGLVNGEVDVIDAVGHVVEDILHLLLLRLQYKLSKVQRVSEKSRNHQNKRVNFMKIII